MFLTLLTLWGALGTKYFACSCCLVVTPCRTSILFILAALLIMILLLYNVACTTSDLPHRDGSAEPGARRSFIMAL